MARKPKHEEHENHERWLVSYADFITLLFAFFVVMYSVSSVNEGKYRVMSDSLVAAFRSPTKSIMPIQVGSIAKMPASSAVELPPMVTNRLLEKVQRGPIGGAKGDKGGKDGKAAEAEKKTLHKVANDLAKAFESLIKQDLVTVREGRLWLEVEIRAAVLFDSGSAQIKPGALPVVDQVVAILSGIHNSVRVEGYTDNVPISTGEYRSNWDLSAARAGSMVHHLLEKNFDPLRLSLAGYGEYRPLVANDSEENRSRNRRVVLVVLATPDAAAQRDLELGLSQPKGEAATVSFLPGAPAQAQAMLSSEGAAPAETPVHSAAGRWPADRGVAAPAFVALPPLPQIAPPR